MATYVFRIFEHDIQILLYYDLCNGIGSASLCFKLAICNSETELWISFIRYCN